jgi:hypothetical protein
MQPAGSQQRYIYPYHNRESANSTRRAAYLMPFSMFSGVLLAT